MSRQQLPEASAERAVRPTSSTPLLLTVLDNLIWLLLFCCLLVMVVTETRFFSTENIMTLLVNSTILGTLVIAEALCLIIGKFDISIESTLAFGALVGALLVKSGLPPILAMAAVILTGAAIGAVNAVAIVGLGANPFMQTLSMNIIFRGLMLVFTGGMTIYNFPAGYRILGATYVGVVPTPVVIVFILYAVFLVILERRKWGRRLYAIGANERAAYASGINVRRINVQVFVIAGALAAFAGLIASTRINGIPNNLAKGQILEVFAAAVMGGISLTGGRGRLVGAVGGVLFLGCITSMLTWLGVSAFLVQTVRGCIILFAIVLDALKNMVRERMYLT